MNVARRTGQDLRTTCYNRPMRPHDYAPRPAHIKWLLDSDPAIRWQVMSDLTDEVGFANKEEKTLLTGPASLEMFLSVF